MKETGKRRFLITHTACLIRYQWEEREVEVPEGVASIGIEAFADSSVRAIRLPDSVTCIEDRAFARSHLENIEIPSGVHSIGAGAFSDCPYLREVTVGERIFSLGDGIFSGCRALQVLRVPWEHFSEIRSQSANLLAGAKGARLGIRFFDREDARNTKMRREAARIFRDVILPMNLHEDLSSFLSMWERMPLSLWKELFRLVGEGDAWAEIRLRLLEYRAQFYPPEVVEQLEEERIAKAMGLLPMTVEDWDEIFRYEICQDQTVRLTGYVGESPTVYIPRTIGEYPVKSIYPLMFSVGARHGYHRSLDVYGGVQAFVVDEDHEYLSSVNGSLYSKDKTRLLLYASDGEAYLFAPDSLQVIGEHAFFRATELESVILPHGAREIGTLAFAHCKRLERITLPDTLEWIRGGAFYGCSCLSDVQLPAGLRSLERTAFCQCQALEELEIPDSVTAIGAEAMRGCSSLKRVHVGEGVAEIEECAFMDCTSLLEVHLGRGIRYLAHNAFAGCSAELTVYYAGDALSWEKITQNKRIRVVFTDTEGNN